MGLLNVFKKSEPAPSGSPAVFTRSYTNMDRFKGTRRMHITIYDDDLATKNATRLLNGEHLCDCVGREITLAGFTHDNGSGIRVSVDRNYIGVLWEGYNEDIYPAVWNGDIEGVFIRIEMGPEDKPEAKLFVKLAE